jgi:hypothetical protein
MWSCIDPSSICILMFSFGKMLTLSAHLSKALLILLSFCSHYGVVVYIMCVHVWHQNPLFYTWKVVLAFTLAVWQMSFHFNWSNLGEWNIEALTSIPFRINQLSCGGSRSMAFTTWVIVYPNTYQLLSILSSCCFCHGVSIYMEHVHEWPWIPFI